MCAWFEELDAGPVVCVSFATKGQQRPQAVMQMHRWAERLNNSSCEMVLQGSFTYRCQPCAAFHCCIPN
jgi:hypothetical protein